VQAGTVQVSALLVEDDARIRQALALALADEGFDVVQASTGEEGLAAIERGAPFPDVVLLDVMLPGADGIEICRRIRDTSDVPIIMITARTDTKDVIAGLEAGADDYVTKPLVAAELSARIRALLRRAAPGPDDGREDDDGIALRDLRIDRGRGSVSRGGEPLHLTKTEFRLLWELAQAGGRVVSRERLLERVWGYGYFGDTRLLDVHIRRLRRKIEADPGQPAIVLTVRGQGYRVDA
jgi:two-component system response regulator MtrA